MNTFNSSDEQVMLSPGGRKRRLNKDNHKREQNKKIRHSGGGLVPAVACTHTTTVARNSRIIDTFG